LKIIGITGKISYINMGVFYVDLKRRNQNADLVMADNILINKGTTNLSQRILFPGVSLLVVRILTDFYNMRRAILSVKYRLTF
jgi:hypothetical protein